MMPSEGSCPLSRCPQCSGQTEAIRVFAALLWRCRRCGAQGPMDREDIGGQTIVEDDEEP